MSDIPFESNKSEIPNVSGFSYRGTWLVTQANVILPLRNFYSRLKYNSKG